MVKIHTMPAHTPTLEFLVFDASTDTDGRCTFDALASTSPALHGQVQAEARSVLAWVTERFPEGVGDLDEGASWCHDLQIAADGEWMTVSLTLSGTAAFGEIFANAFANAIGQGQV